MQKKCLKERRALKVEIIDDAEQTDNFQIYTNADEDFIDLCRGPHLPNLSFIGAFKLTKVSGAYWKEILQMKCLQEFMEQHGEMKKSFKSI